MIKIREANEEDNGVLIELERKCPMGINLVLSHDSSPDYFARSRPFKDWHVLVATENNRIVGSVVYAIRDTMLAANRAKPLTNTASWLILNTDERELQLSFKNASNVLPFRKTLTCYI